MPATRGLMSHAATPSDAAATTVRGASITPPHRRRAFASSAASPGAAECADSGNNSPPRGTIDPELLELLACPLTKQPLEVCQAGNGGTFLLSRAAGARFPVGRNGIPRLRPLQDGEVVAVGGAAEDGSLGNGKR